MIKPTGLAYDKTTRTLFIADPDADAIFAAHLGIGDRHESHSSDDDAHVNISSASSSYSLSSSSATAPSLNVTAYTTVLQRDSMLSNPFRIALHISGHLMVTTFDKHAVYFVLLGCDHSAPQKPCTCRVSFMGLNFPGGSCVFPIGIENKAGFNDGPAGGTQFSFPVGMAVGPDGTVYVADSGNNAIRVIALLHGTSADGMDPVSFWKSLSSARVTTLVGGPGVVIEESRLRSPHDVAIGPDGTSVYVADTKWVLVGLQRGE